MKNQESRISILVNAAFYFLQWVFILKDESREHYRLVALQNNRIIIDQNYNTLRGAKIGCAKTIQIRGFRSKLKTQWSPFFSPEGEWLADKLKRCEGQLNPLDRG